MEALPHLYLYKHSPSVRARQGHMLGCQTAWQAGCTWQAGLQGFAAPAPPRLACGGGGASTASSRIQGQRRRYQAPLSAMPGYPAARSSSGSRPVPSPEHPTTRSARMMSHTTVLPRELRAWRKGRESGSERRWGRGEGTPRQRRAPGAEGKGAASAGYVVGYHQ